MVCLESGYLWFCLQHSSGGWDVRGALRPGGLRKPVAKGCRVEGSGWDWANSNDLR